MVLVQRLPALGVVCLGLACAVVAGCSSDQPVAPPADAGQAAVAAPAAALPGKAASPASSKFRNAGGKVTAD